MREKLIELIGTAEYGKGSLIGNNFQRGFIEKIADHLIANGVTVQQWIPVTERLPEDDLVENSEVKLLKVLVFYKTSMGVPVVRTQIRQKGRRYHRDEWSWAKFEPITHWMPLPEPPKEG